MGSRFRTIRCIHNRNICIIMRGGGAPSSSLANGPPPMFDVDRYLQRHMGASSRDTQPGHRVALNFVWFLSLSRSDTSFFLLWSTAASFLWSPLGSRPSVPHKSLPFAPVSNFSWGHNASSTKFALNEIIHPSVFDCFCHSCFILDVPKMPIK